MDLWDDQVVKARPKPRPYRIPSSAKSMVREALQGPAPLGAALRELTLLQSEGLLKDFAIGGAVGTMRYTEPFTTMDLDIFYIPVNDDLTAGLPMIYAHFKQRGILPEKEYIVMGGLPVQLLAVDSLTREAVERAPAVDFEGMSVKVCSAEHLLAMAVRTGRLKDRVRVQMLLDQGRIDRRKLDDILARHGLVRAFAAMKKEAA